MPHQEDFDEETSRRDFKGPYGSRHTIPTVQKYRAEQSERESRQKETAKAQHEEQDDPTYKRAYHAARDVITGEDEPQQSEHDPYPTANRNTTDPRRTSEEYQIAENRSNGDQSADSDQKEKSGGKRNDNHKTTTEIVAGSDAKQKRKDMKHYKRDDGGREVTDPITHLPIVIKDSTTKDLDKVPENEPEAGSVTRSATDLEGASKSKKDLDKEKRELQQGHDDMRQLFPPPNIDSVKAELARTYQSALTYSLIGSIGLATLAMLIIQSFDLRIFNRKEGSKAGFFLIPAILILSSGSIFGLVSTVRGWLGRKVEETWKDEVWDAARNQEIKVNEDEHALPESVAWLNSMLASIWPLINPDLFTSIADMLEDVMQASLPKVVRMVSIDDLGQGSEAVRILGIRWLPTGAASQSVDADGNLKPAKESQKESDRTTQGVGQVEEDVDKDEDSSQQTQSQKARAEEKQKEQEDIAMREGMEAEQGDFVNMELAFSYRARSTGKSLKKKAKNAHLYLKFYLPGSIAVPVWVELRGLVGTMRLRLQLTPDPPFFSLCTLTFLGQPRADLSCVPLSKHALNLMDVPLISSFVQSSIDAALAEYVAPKSLTLDLKDMLVGDDFKKDTSTRGVVIIYIKRARGFKEGDGGFGPLKGSSDCYITVSWGKFGKPVASTRIIEEEQEPDWHEWAHILVSPEELNATEKLRLQLWDSDKYTADDDLGRVEVDLHRLIKTPESHNQMQDREDRFKGEDADEKMPGTLTWSVGYFSKTKITKDQLAKQTANPNIKTDEDLKKHVSETAQRKLREATTKDESKELKQQTEEDYKEMEDNLIISSPPPDNYPSGVLSIQIHNIIGLQVEKLQKTSKEGETEREDEAEQTDDMPSSYVNIILNHQKVYRTRTKPKNSKPFFNAGTERFIRNWQTTEIMLSVRDDREGEEDALLGIVYLPLGKILEKRSQVMDFYPLVGGVGYGRIRVSLVFRSVELQWPKELLGWEYGTLEVKCPLKAAGQLSGDLTGHRIRIRTGLGKARLHAQKDGTWAPRKGQEQVFLAIRKRYSSAFMVEFRKSTLGPDPTIAFGVFWLQDMPDEETKTVRIKIWKGGKKNEKRATTSCDYNGMEEGEQPLGELEVQLRYWRGLSEYHKKYAEKGKDNDMWKVMEVLDTANDEMAIEDGDSADNDDSSSSSSDSDDDTDEALDRETVDPKRKLRTHTNQSGSDSEKDGKDEVKDTFKNPISKFKSKMSDLIDATNTTDGDNDGSRGARAQVKDYKDHHKQLHRKHRGLMQWKGPRTVDWMVGKAKRGKGRIEQAFQHTEKSTGVETEV